MTDEGQNQPDLGHLLTTRSRFEVHAKPNSKHAKISFDEKSGSFSAELKSRPENNMANIELLKLLRKNYKKNFRIVSGMKSKRKIVEITNE